jgi:hypothetical protein
VCVCVCDSHSVALVSSSTSQHYCLMVSTLCITDTMLTLCNAMLSSLYVTLLCAGGIFSWGGSLHGKLGRNGSGEILNRVDALQGKRVLSLIIADTVCFATLL